MAFGLLALPAGILAIRRGQKTLVMLGLLVTVLGHLLPCFLVPLVSFLYLAVLGMARKVPRPAVE